MARILLLETTAQVCSVALALDGVCVATLEHEEANAHSRVLLPLVGQLLENNNWDKASLQAVAVSAGPGSYTGLRIGSSTAKGIAFSLGIPLLSVGTLTAFFRGMRQENPGFDWYIGLLDARRMEVYSAVFDASGRDIEPVSAQIITENPYVKYLDSGRVLFFGSGVEKCREIVHHRNAQFEISAYPRSSYMAEIAHNLFINNKLENIAYYQPQYLKAFWTAPKKQV